MTIEENPIQISKLRTNVGKISFVGSPAVGKTTLMKLLTQRQIEKKYNWDKIRTNAGIKYEYWDGWMAPLTGMDE